MKNILYVISLLVLITVLLPSCDSLFNKENDYLPLKVGVKYKYKYSEFYHYIDGGYQIKGECSWNFIRKSAGVYHVEQSFNGNNVWTNQFGKKDSAQIVNQISALSFEVQHDGKVVFTWPQEKVTLERFIQSDRNDTCFRSNPYEQVCLRKNVGITNLFVLPMHGNHSAGSGYTLIEGPPY